jgi:stage V sporulation protein B
VTDTPPVGRPPESMARGAALVTGAAALFVASGYAVNVWLGRMLGPDDYGRFGVVLAMITILNILQNSSVPQAVARYTASHPHAASVLLRRGLVLQLGVGLVLAIGLAAGASLIAAVLGDPELTDAVRAAALIVPPYGVFALFLAYHNGSRHYTRQAGAQAAYAITKALAVITLAYPLRLVGAILGYVVAALVGCAAAAVRPTGDGPSVGLWRLLRLAAPLSVYALASVAQFSADIFFVKGLGVTDADAGLYAASQNIARIPYFLMTGLAVLVLPALAGTVRGSLPAASNTARQALRLSVLAAVPIAALVAGTAPGALDLLYGSTYAEAADVLRILAVAMAALAVASIAAGALSGVGNPAWSAAISVLGLGVAIAGCVVLIPVMGPVGGAVATTVSAAATLALLLARLAAVLPGAIPWTSILRTTLCSAAVAVGLAVVDARGLALIVAYVVASALGAGLLIVTGEVGRADLDRLRTALRRH